MASDDSKVVLITGAKGGLGSFVTQAFLDAGARVAGTSRSIRADDFPHPNFHAIPAELTDQASARQLGRSVLEAFGRLDAAVHLVGGFDGGSPVEDTDPDLLDRMLNTNLKSAFLLAHAVLPVMKTQGRGHFVAVGSRAAVEGNAGVGAYSASKAALIALVRAISLENKNNGITANIVLPGTIDTPVNRAAMPKADFSRWVQPARIADVILALCSDGFSQVTGAAIPIYGTD